jgi:nicotinate phosphoribosyltransferase
VEYAGRPRRKQSEKKVTLPGRKQVYRGCDAEGMLRGDTIALTDEAFTAQTGLADSAPRPGGNTQPLLARVMAEGERIDAPSTLGELREYHAAQIQRLPTALRALDAQDSYPVSVSTALRQLGEQTDQYIRRHLEAETERLGID